jgi:hypothetical protein
VVDIYFISWCAYLLCVKMCAEKRKPDLEKAQKKGCGFHSFDSNQLSECRWFYYAVRLCLEQSMDNNNKNNEYNNVFILLHFIPRQKPSYYLNYLFPNIYLTFCKMLIYFLHSMQNINTLCNHGMFVNIGITVCIFGIWHNAL